MLVQSFRETLRTSYMVMIIVAILLILFPDIALILPRWIHP
jgi:hypothetical protein